MDSAAASLLEIPPQLAFVFSKLDGWQPVHTEGHLSNIDDVTPSTVDFVLPADINKHTLADYKDICCKDTLGRLSDVPLSRPMLSKSNERDAHDSLMISKLLYRYVFDKTLSSQRQRVIADYITQCGLSNAIQRDEIFLQICNLTLAKLPDDCVSKIWVLMVQCLSCFKPSLTLYSYLLKYVSDHAFNGFKSICQYKLLDGPHWSTVIPRVYPPCLLEWTAVNKRQPMAVQAVFADGYSLTGHVDSWTLSEDFASEVLACRQVADKHGWTMSLTDDNGVYECAGDDYLLDILSEMDVAPGFPCSQSYFLVVPSRSGSPGSQDSPHNADKLRLMEVTGVDDGTSQPAPSSGLLSGQSALNARYLQQPGATIDTNHHLENGSVISGDGYSRHINPGGAGGGPGGPGGLGGGPGRTLSRDTATMMSATTDMDQWLEKVFDQALDGTVDDSLEESQMLSGRLKGGGDEPYRVPQRTVLNAPAFHSQQPATAFSTQSTGFQAALQHPANTTIIIPSTGTQPYQQPTSSFIMPSAGIQSPQMLQTFSLPAASSVSPQSSYVLPLGTNSVSAAPSYGTPSYVTQTLLAPSVTSFPVGTLNSSAPITYTAEQLLQQQMLQQQQWQLQRENMTLQAQLEAQHVQNQMLKQTLQQQQQQQHLHQTDSLSPSTSIHHPHSPSPSPSPTIVTVGDYQPRPSSGNVNHNPLSMHSNAGALDRAPYISTVTNGNMKATAPIVSEASTSSFNRTSPEYEIVRTNTVSPTIEVRFGDSQTNNNYNTNNNNQRVTSPTDRPPSIIITSEPVTIISATPPPPPLSPMSSHPPPAPPIAGLSKNRPAVKNYSAGDALVDRPVKVGKIQWPPPKHDSDDDQKPSASIRRLEIEEKDATTVSQPAATKPGPDLFKQKIMERVPEPRNVAENKPRPLSMAVSPVPRPPVVAVDRDFHWQPRPAAADNQPLYRPPPQPRPQPSTPAQVPPLQHKQQQQQQMETVKENGIAEQTSVVQRPAVELKTRQSVAETSNALQPLSSSVVRRDAPGASLFQSTVDRSDSVISSQHSRPVSLINGALRTETSQNAQTSNGAVKVPAVSTFDSPTVDLFSLEQVQTVLHEQNYNKTSFITYSNVKWNLNVRKEVFFPMEMLDDQLLVDLIYAQIVSDVSSNSLRFSQRERASIKSVLDGQGVNAAQILTDRVPDAFKKSVINMARSCSLYFSRIYAVNGGRPEPDVHLLSISHSGIRTVCRRRQSPQPDVLDVIHYLKYEDILDVTVPKPKTLQIHLSTKHLFLYTHRAKQIRNLIEAFCIEFSPKAARVRAIKSYKAQDSTQLSFNSRDIITVADGNANAQNGWLYGALHGRVGVFPVDIVAKLNAPGSAKSSSQSSNNVPAARAESVNGKIGTVNGSLIDAKVKYTMLEFAMLCFRDSPFREATGSKIKDSSSVPKALEKISSLRLRNGSRRGSRNATSKDGDWTWKEQVELIKWSNSPIRSSLLKLDSASFNKLAIDCFMNAMQYMGDAPNGDSSARVNPVGCAINILAICHEHTALVDEVYCQLIKQTTNNRSTKSDSCQLGWRLMSVMTSYFLCSDALRPYLLAYLQQTANDERRANYMLARSCLRNLNQTVRYGGRKAMPSKEELESITQGRCTNQMAITLSGGSVTRVTVYTSTVVHDVTDQICDTLDITQASEKQEYSLHLLIKDATDTRAAEPPDLYLLDILNETLSKTKNFKFLVLRSSWFYPLRLDTTNQTYVNVMYQQVRQVYIDGYPLVLPNKSLPDPLRDQIALLAALQIRASDKAEVPSQKDLELFIPDNALQLHSPKLSRWLQLVVAQLENVKQLSQLESQIRFLDMLSRWPFGFSSYFMVQVLSTVPKGVVSKGASMLAINRNGLHLCHAESHETTMFVTFADLLSVRRTGPRGIELIHVVRGKSNKASQLHVQLQTEQAEQIELLIGHYLQLTNKQKLPAASAVSQRPSHLEY